VVHYVRPCFKANVKALATVARHDWTPLSEGLINLVKSGKTLKGEGREVCIERLLPYADIDQEK
jgi:hypothetical protein